MDRRIFLMKMNMDTILRTEHLCKYYGAGENEVRAVDDVNIAIGRGEFVAVVGKSGSGKSTLLHLLGGLDYPTGGKVYVGDMELFSLKEDALAVFRRRKMGFVFQAFNLVSSINVWENIVLPAGLDGRRCDTAFVRDIVGTLGLGDKIRNLPNTLSGGQQQRVAIARALSTRPDIVFADEPTGNLDSHTTVEVMKMICEFARKHHETIILVSHDPEMASYADRIVTLVDGEIVSDRRTAKEQIG